MKEKRREGENEQGEDEEGRLLGSVLCCVL